MTTVAALYLATSLFGASFSVPAVMPGTPPALVSTAPQVTRMEQSFVDAVNRERWDRSLGFLSVNPVLVEAARRHSREMYEKNYFDHHSPTPGLTTPMRRYVSTLGHVPNYARLGENLFYCSVCDPTLGHKCLMESEPHRANIIDGQFREIGVGIFVAPDGQFWVTQLFLNQKD